MRVVLAIRTRRFAPKTNTPDLNASDRAHRFRDGGASFGRGFLFPLRTSCGLSLCSPHQGTLAIAPTQVAGPLAGSLLMLEGE